MSLIGNNADLLHISFRTTKEKESRQPASQQQQRQRDSLAALLNDYWVLLPLNALLSISEQCFLQTCHDFGLLPSVCVSLWLLLYLRTFYESEVFHALSVIVKQKKNNLLSGSHESIVEFFLLFITFCLLTPKMENFMFTKAPNYVVPRQK